MKASSLFDLPKSLQLFSDFFKPEMHPWEWVKHIKEALAAANIKPSRPNQVPPAVFIGENVFVHPSVKLPPYACLEGPAYIGPDVEIRPGAYVRSNVIVGQGALLGNACEFKNCLLMDNVQAPHYNYVGDSVLGNDVHLGAGVILANLRLDQKNVPVKGEGESFDSGMRKLGAILGEHAEVGCNAVLQPGAVLGKKAIVMPTIAFNGYLPEGKMAMMPGKPIIRDRAF